jgi:hypothetical protein
MKASEIEVGGTYTARVSGNLVAVRVDAIRETVESRGSKLVDGHRYDVTNLATGRKLTFRSAAKFRGKAVCGKWISDNDPAGPTSERCRKPAEHSGGCVGLTVGVVAAAK